ncbi:PaaI family thioesterase [Aldersonia sp. NBC_00410]|uniref:PaaI family thioesterase n=1 Tax=Aldersonia sp. NBC_00410 TaxID=2975954 RepID=UPI0022564F3F|nr:PaaI family thioesterase [Aldersonia sp. NBC_00410]MCX5045484.1 PaaI family thioesterase [Aldersonia sp. NBC_00410]
MFGRRSPAAEKVVSMNPEVIFRIESDPGRGSLRMGLGPWCTDDAGYFSPASLAVGVDALLGAQIHLARFTERWTVTSELTIDSFADPEPSARYLDLRTAHLSNDDGGGAGTCEVVTGSGRVIAAGLLRSRYVPPLPEMPREFRFPSNEERTGEPEPKSVLDAIGGRVELAESGALLVVGADSRLRNFSGVLHGGIVSTASSLAGLAALDSSVPKRIARYSVNFVRPVPIDVDAIFEATAVHDGRGFGVSEVIARTAEGKVGSFATVTAYARPGDAPTP